MKITLEIPDDLFRRIQTTLAAREESLEDFVTNALQIYLERRGSTGWQSVFGRARREEVEFIDRTIAEECESVDLDEW